MKRLTLLVLFLATCAVSLAQTITKMELAKDNGQGKPAAIVKEFAPSDNPIHCVLHLKPLSAPVVFTGSLIAVDAAGVKNYLVATTNLSAGMKMDQVDFRFSLPRDWPTGSYRVDVKVDGKVLKSISFQIK